MGGVYAEEVCTLGMSQLAGHMQLAGHFSQLAGVLFTGSWLHLAACWLLFTIHFYLTGCNFLNIGDILMLQK